MWALSQGYPPLPGELAHIAEYVMGLLMLGASSSGAGMVLSAIRWGHRQAGAEPPPSDDRIPAIPPALAEGRVLTSADVAKLIAASGRTRSYRVAKGERFERKSRTRKRAVTDSIIIGLGWETLATASEIADLRWSDVDLEGCMVRYHRQSWSPISVALARRLGLVVRGETEEVVGLSPASVRRRVREAAGYGGLGPEFPLSQISLRHIRTSAIRALAARGASMADLIRPLRSGQGGRHAGQALVSHIQNTPVPT